MILLAKETEMERALNQIDSSSRSSHLNRPIQIWGLNVVAARTVKLQNKIFSQRNSSNRKLTHSLKQTNTF